MIPLIAFCYIAGTLLPFVGLHLVAGLIFSVGIFCHFYIISKQCGQYFQPRKNYNDSTQYHTHYHQHDAPQFNNVVRAEEHQTKDYRTRRLTQWNN